MTAVNTMQLLLETEVASRQIVRGRVVLVHDDATVSIMNDNGGMHLRCDVLQTGEKPGLLLAESDTVLIWLPANDEGRGVILGRIGASHAPAPACEPASTAEIPDTLVIEARKNLTLRVGDGSVTIREDGKILIKGKDLVSHAQRTNRIKGGSVAIN